MSQTATPRQFHRPDREPFHSESLSFSPFHLRSGNFKFRNRVISPILGRWWSNDPLGFEAGDVKPFRYAENGSGIKLDPNELQVGKPVNREPTNFPYWGGGVALGPQNGKEKTKRPSVFWSTDKNYN